jgi:hypothetical protein
MGETLITSKYYKKLEGWWKKLKEIQRWRFGVVAPKGYQN